MSSAARMITLLTAVLPGVAMAQQIESATVRGLVSGQSITVERATDGAPRWLACFEFNTEPGDFWELHVGTNPPRAVQWITTILTAHETCDLSNGREIDEQAVMMQDGTERQRSHLLAGGGPYRLIVTSSDDAKRMTVSARKVYSDPSGAGQAASRASLLASDLYLSQVTSPTASTSPGSGETSYARGEAFRDCEAVCPAMVVLPAGEFLMGSTAAEEGRASNEGPAHQVTFARPFAIGKYEVTFDEWNACVADGDCRRIEPPASAGGRRPVTMVTWVDARTYAEWLTRKTGQRYFLPSESEWEYAARAGTSTPWNTGDAIITDDANILDQFGQPVPVGGFPPNAFGLHDMHGNVYEWVLDCLDVGYFGVPVDGGAMVTPGCARRVVRGGGWRSEPGRARSAVREGAPPDYGSVAAGFRVARAL